MEIVATYQSHNKEPRVAHHTLSVPLLLACKPRTALKTAQHKITLDTLHAAVPLSTLFEDFITSASELGDITGTAGGAFSLGFQFWGNSVPISLSHTPGTAPSSSSMMSSHQPAVVSILVSKNAGRYRVQSDSLPALLVVLSELERRLSLHIANEGLTSGSGSVSEGRAVTCDDEYPLIDYFSAIGAHFDLRGKLAEQLSNLNDSAHQFRMVQKRLLVRFKDRNPTPLLGLDALMRESYDNLLRISKYCTVL